MQEIKYYFAHRNALSTLDYRFSCRSCDFCVTKLLPFIPRRRRCRPLFLAHNIQSNSRAGKLSIRWNLRVFAHP